MTRRNGMPEFTELLLLAGDDLLPVRLPGPVTVVDPPPPLEPLPDFRRAVAAALSVPLGSPPLEQLVRGGGRVTVAFDDPCLPLPPLLLDPRRVMLEEVVDRVSRAGVRDEDITLICANGLHRTWTAWELAPLLGPRLLRRFQGRVRCYDAEDPRANVELGATASGLLAEVSRTLVETDLVVYVALPWTEMNGGHKSLACGLSTYRCIDQHHNPLVQAESPLMHPGASEMHRRLREVGRHVGAQVPVFQVECVLDNRVWAGPLKLLDLRRRRLPLGFSSARRLPQAARGLARRGLRSWYRPAGIWAGAVEPVHASVLARMNQTRSCIESPADVLLLGLPDMNPYAVYSRMNPILTANAGLGYSFQFGRQRPLVRLGGWVVLASPCRGGFHRRHHVAYRKFWDEVLPRTRDPHQMYAEFQPRYADDPSLIAAYRFARAYHPVHPFYAWYWTTRALAHVGGVVIAGGDDPRIVERLGFHWAPTVEEGVAFARTHAGDQVLFQSMPPVFSVDVARA